MSSQPLPETIEEGSVACATCGDEIDCCAFCDDPKCQVAKCYECVRADLGLITPQPHAHGG